MLIENSEVKYFKLSDYNYNDISNFKISIIMFINFYIK